MKKIIQILTLLLLASSVELSAQETRFFTRFSSDYEVVSNLDNWASYELSAGLVKPGKYILQGNGRYSKRFDFEDTQFSINSTWNIDSVTYISTKLGASRGIFLPGYSGYLELFRVVNKTELSLGYKYMIFEDPVSFLTGSIGYYWKSEWTNLRLYVARVNDQSDPLLSLRLMHRHYWSKREYWELSLGRGRNVNQNSEQLEQVIFESTYTELAINKRFKKIMMRLGYTYYYQDLSSHIRTKQKISLDISYNR